MIFVALLAAMKRKIPLTRQEVFENRSTRPTRSATRNAGPPIGEMLERRTLLSGTIASGDAWPAAAPLSQGGIFLQDTSANLVSAASTVVSIPDPYLRHAVGRALGKSAAQITEADMLSLTSLTANHVHDHVHTITDLTGLQYATNLTHLNLNFNEISDLSPLRGLTNLTKLHLYENRITDVSALGELTRLRGLDLGLNNVGDTSALSEMTRMVELNLHGNRVSDLGALSAMKDLMELNLRANQVAALDALSGLTRLQHLDLRFNELSNSTPDWMAVISLLQARGTVVLYLPQ
jgi:hypothetical protein